MQYQVLARKWRPRTFHELVGQAHVSQTLLNALTSGRVAHAFLFSGPRGSGKTSTARLLAKALNCRDGKPGEPCNQCVACVEIAAGNCMDVLEIDAASNRGIDEIRELKEKARYNPARDRNKIFIIDEVHMLTTEAFNALLKILEEPPPHVVFILATTESHKIPATILSRCQQYSFKLIQYPLIVGRLREIASAEGIHISDCALEQVVFSSGGSMRDAMSALDQVIAFSGDHVRDEDVSALLGMVEPKVLQQTVHAIAGNDLPTLLKVVADLSETGQDLTNFCRRLSGQFRNLMLLNAGITDPALIGVPESLIPQLRSQADLFSREDILRLFDAFQKIETGMKYATQVRFHLEMGLIELAHIARLRSLEELVSEFSSFAEDEPPSTPGASAYSSTASNVRPEVMPDVAAPVAAPVAAHIAATNRVKTSSAERDDRLPATPRSGRPVAPVSSDSKKIKAGNVPPAPDENRLLLQRIGSATGREAIESLLLSFAGARLQDDRIILDPGDAGDFVRSQIKGNLQAIAEAASGVVGQKVSVTLEDGQAAPQGSAPREKSRKTPAAPGAPPDDLLLDKARREPVVKSFLDVFPGPVKAEKIDS
jgi:DNA polymerase III subunit gamma/tau